MVERSSYAHLCVQLCVSLTIGYGWCVGHREGAYKLEAAALAGMGEAELSLWLYGQACQPTTCVQGENRFVPFDVNFLRHLPSSGGEVLRCSKLHVRSLSASLTSVSTCCVWPRRVPIASKPGAARLSAVSTTVSLARR